MDQVALCHYLIDKGLLHSQDATFTPLSGGVSCEFLLVDDGQSRFVVKRALDKLKVKDDWFADIKRNITEQEYLRYVGKFLPESVPTILYSDTERYFFYMEMIESGLGNWKSRLLLGEYDRQYARLAGDYLGTIHRRSLGDMVPREKFDALKDFSELRLDPYLLKALHRTKDAAQILGLGLKVWERYTNAADAVAGGQFEARLCHLLPMLMLARVDGKSPVEYLDSSQQQTLRDFAYAVVPDSPRTFNRLVHQWAELLTVE